MAKAGGAQPPEFLSTHPSNKTRQDNLKEWLPDAQRYYEKAPENNGIGAPIN